MPLSSWLRILAVLSYVFPRQLSLSPIFRLLPLSSPPLVLLFPLSSFEVLSFSVLSQLRVAVSPQTQSAVPGSLSASCDSYSNQNLRRGLLRPLSHHHRARKVCRYIS